MLQRMLLLLVIGRSVIIKASSPVRATESYRGHLTHNDGYCTNCALSLTVTDGSSSEWKWKWDHDSTGKTNVTEDDRLVVPLCGKIHLNLNITSGFRNSTPPAATGN